MAVKTPVLFSAIGVLLTLALSAGASCCLGAEQPADEHWAKILADGKLHSETRVQAARKLGEAKNGNYLEALTDALNDSNKAIRWTAAEALWELGDKRAVPALIQYLEKGEAYEWGKVVTMNALASFKDLRSIDPLIRVLQSQNPFLRRSAAVALFTIGDERAIPPLISLLKDDQGFIQRIAQTFLAELTKHKMTGDIPSDYDGWMTWLQKNSGGSKLSETK